MKKNMNYEEMFKWVAEQTRRELGWIYEELEENGSDRLLIGQKIAYESVLGLIENLEKKGYEGYKKECEEIVKKYENLLKEEK